MRPRRFRSKSDTDYKPKSAAPRFPLPANVVEGCARRTTRDYERFVTIALGSACEMRYLASVAFRLQMIPQSAYEELERQCEQVVTMLQKLQSALEAME